MIFDPSSAWSTPLIGLQGSKERSPGVWFTKMQITDEDSSEDEAARWFWSVWSNMSGRFNPRVFGLDLLLSVAAKRHNVDPKRFFLPSAKIRVRGYTRLLVSGNCP